MYSLLGRHAEAVVTRAFATFRVVVLNGARQVGKTTLMRQCAADYGAEVVSLDDPVDLAAAVADPVGFVTGFGLPLAIDEAQRGGDPLVLAVKLCVDRDSAPGRFLLTGSSRFVTVPGLTESLAGRAHVVDLWPLSQGELGGVRETFLTAIFDGPDAVRALRPVDWSRADYAEALCRGGFPEAVRLDPDQRQEWLASYVRLLALRDVAQLARIRGIDDLPRLIRMLAARTAAELNVAGLAADAGMAADTVRSYLDLLETAYLHHRVPAWSRNLTTKHKRRPKTYFTDSGLAAHLLGAEPAALARPTSAHLGTLLETFVVGELARARTWSGVDVGLHHYRDRNGVEIDLVLERRDGRIAAIEVKAATDAGPGDAHRLAWLRDRLGIEFALGVVLHTGSRSRVLGDRLLALPISTLWATV